MLPPMLPLITYDGYNPPWYEDLIDKNKNIGGWLINELIVSDKTYFIGIGNNYPTLPNLSAHSTSSLSNGCVGVEANLDSSLFDCRYENQNNLNGTKPQSLLPPVGIDSVVWFHPDILLGNPPIEYWDGNSNTSLGLGPCEGLFFIAFHELLEAYYKVDKGMPYVDCTNRQVGAHPEAIRKESDWRRQLNINGANFRIDVTGGVVRRRR